MKQLRRKLRQSVASFLALCLTMTSFNMVSWADVEKAFDSGNAIFMISGEELRNSAQAAIDAGETFQVDDLGLGDKDQSLKREYEKLFGKGLVYEFSPGYYMDEEASADGAELRMFIRTADTDGEYLLTGDEEVIFLYVNESDEKITFRSNIDGYLTQKVSVKAFSEGTTAIPNVPEVQPEPTLPEESAVNPEETETAEETEEESEAVDETEDAEETGSTEETEEDDNVEESSEAEDGTEDAEEGSEAESGSEETADDEGQADSEEASDDADTGSEDSDAGSSDDGGSEAEDTDNGSSHEGSGAQASISRHMLSVLTSSDVTALEEGTPSEAEPEVEDEPVVDEGEGSAVLGNTKGKTYGAVLLDESYYAKAYVTTLNQLNVDTTAEGYRVTYSVEPVGTAYAEGPKAVEENGTLSFKVAPQVGYVVSSVTVNGEAVDADEAGSGRTLSYTVAEVAQEQEVVILTTATGEHPEFSASIPVEDGTVIHIYAAEGILPAGVEAVAEVVPEIESVLKEKVEGEDGGQVASVLAYDINLMLDGEKLDNTWADNGYVTVTFSGNRIKKETAEGSSVKIYAVDDTGAEELNADTAETATVDALTLESVGETLDVSGDSGVNKVSFEAEHFTIYAIVIDGENTPVATYNFYNGGNEPINTQKVKNGEVLVEPEVPEVSGANKFLGWSADDARDRYQAFGPVSVSESQVINLHARFSQVYHVTFYNQYGSVKEIKEAIPNQQVSVDVTIDVLADEALTGWKIKGSSNIVGSTVTVTNSNIDLEPVIEKVKWITYYANGGSYTKPAYVAAGQKTIEPTEPARAGYTFGGWYEKKDLSGSRFIFETEINKNISLYAKWTPKSGINYTVIHWKENANDDDYSFWKSENKTGTAGSATAAKSASEDGFEVKAFSQGNIAGDGSTIINIYYSRKTYSVKFYDNSKNKEIENLRISAKYGADIKEFWPKPPQAMWRTTRNGTTYQSGIEVMPLGGKSFYSYSSSGKYTINSNYYLEVLAGETHDATHNNRKYKLDHTDSDKSSNYNWKASKEDWYDIKGFTYSGNISAGDSFKKVGNTNTYQLDFYYNRNEYAINFVNGGSVAHTINKKYEENITSVKYTPAKPTNLSSEYTFAGWYDNEDCIGTPYSFAGKMPAYNITLYAKWAAPQFKIKFDLKGGSGSGNYDDQTVGYGNKANQPDDPTKADYKFAGWMADDDLFNFETQIYKNTSLIARWISDHTLKVVYDAGEGTGTVPVDSQEYVDHSKAVALSPTNLEHSTKHFIGWKLGNKVYYPGQSFEVDKELATDNTVKLVAEWSQFPTQAVLIYHSNFGNDTTVSDTVSNNSTVDIKLGTLFTREGYVFDRWTTEANGEGQSYAPGAKALIDNSNETNHLYAQWKIAMAKFKVEYWLEKDEEFELEESVDHTGTINTTVTAPDKTFTSYIYDATAGNITEGIVRADGQLVLKRYYRQVRAITLKAKDAEAYYTGSALKSTEYETPVTGLRTGDTVTITTTGIVINANDTDGTRTGNNPITSWTITRNGIDVKNQYNVSPEAGTLTVKKVGVTITADSHSRAYGSPNPDSFGYKEEGFVNSENAAYLKLDIQLGTAAQQNSPVDEYDITISGPAITDNYKITYIPGKLTVTKSATDIVIKAKDAGRPYNGIALTKSDFDVISELNGKDYIDRTATNIVMKDTSTRTDVGETFNEIDEEKSTVIIRNESGADVTAGYNSIIFQRGTLKVTKAPLKLKALDGTWEYDGTEKSKPGYTFLDDATLMDVDTIADADVFMNENSKITNVGDKDNKIDHVIIRNAVGVDKTSNYAIDYVDGKLIVTPRTETVTVTANSDEKVYDGNEFKNGGYTWNGLLEGHTIVGVTMTATSTITNVGNEPNVIDKDTIKIMKGNEDVTTQYASNAIQTVDGTLTVTKKTAKVKAKDISVEYGKTPTLAYDPSEFVNGEDPDNLGLGLKLKTEPTDNPNEKRIVFENEPQHDNYQITYEPGTLTITPRTSPVTITAGNAWKIYDGRPLTTNQFKVTGLVTGDRVEVPMTSDSTITDAGKKDNTIDKAEIVILNANGDNVTANYGNVKTQKGTLRVDRALASINAESTYKMYGQSNPELKYKTFGFVDPKDIPDIKLKTNAKDDSPVDIYHIIFEKPQIITKNYVITYWPGVLAVLPNKDAIVIRAKDAEKVYDGTPLTSSEVEILGELANDDRIRVGSVKMTDDSTVTDVGISQPNEIKSVIIENANGKDVTRNYLNITFVPGTLKVTPATLTVKADDQYKMYGQGNPALTYKVTGWPEGVTEYDLGLTLSTTANKNSPVGSDYPITFIEAPEASGNYEFQYEDGVLEIMPLEGGLEFTALDAEKVYDGKELIRSEYSMIGELQEGDRVEKVVMDPDSKITNVGTQSNRIASIVIKNADGEDVTASYSPELKEGTLTVKKAKITVTANNQSKRQGAANPTLIYEIKGLVNGETAEKLGFAPQLTTSATNASGVGKYAITFVDRSKTLENYDIEYKDGELTVESSGTGGGGSTGGGGGGSTPNPNRPFVPGGPGTVTINPEQIPLANLPEGNPADELILIEDNQIPLAGLPKTGDRNVIPNLAAIISGVLLAAYAMITGKKKEEN